MPRTPPLLLLLCLMLLHGGGWCSLGQLSTLVTEVSGRPSADFVSYGRWCGLGGEGTPLDDIDQCCQVHDLCYALCSRGGPCAGGASPYTVDYAWARTRDGGASCGVRQADRCRGAVCLCDVTLALCLRDHAAAYDPARLRPISFAEMLRDAQLVAQPAV